ncbi:MAG TPA: allantoate amidohydrolase [Acidimicrobiales bacterium]|nr:allantoate amidohydrolase [Acidimicrobiales bacterium]
MVVSSGSWRADFERLWEQLAPIGRSASGGYYRLAWTEADLACREWFVATAAGLGLEVEEDGNGNQWAWWGTPGPGALVTGSHLDSVPGGGAYDGPLGVVSAFLAVDRLRAAGARPEPAVAVVNFTDEEGGRFGLACAGSRLMTASIPPERLLARRDPDGVTLADAMARAGRDPAACGPDDARVARIGTFVELHVEQGRQLVDLDVPVGVATAVWPHGRWRVDFAGRGDHAGTTRLADRRDPVLPLAHTVIAARRAAMERDAVATVGRLATVPGATNAIASRATAWLDARAGTAEAARRVVADVEAAARRAGAHHHVEVSLEEESWSGGADFDLGLRARLAAAVKDRLGTVAELPTGAGHDAAILAARVPSAMLFVRNPTGTSHDPAEHAELDDCLAGVDALTAVLEALR